MNKKHTFLLLFLALSLSLWGSFSLMKHWKNNNENAIKKYGTPAKEKDENSKLSVKEYKGFLAQIPQNLYKKVSISALNAKTLPKLGTDIINLTAEAEGYQLRPLNFKFKTPINIEIEYDESKIPEGYTEKDVLLLSFNRQKKSWERISVDEINEGKNLLKSKISQSSDFIAGIIKLPESPDTSGFTPTSISGLKAADPLSGVQSIAPPTANPEGSATTSFAIELPKGRAGMQPNISLQYSNDGGHSWVGQGWNLALPSVNIDTRWGAPRYDAQKETESYILSGEDLLPNTHRAEWEQRSENKVFYPRREGAFSKIVRKGNHPNNYHWEVASKSGIISYYGNNANSVSRTASGNNAHWQISEQRDLRGNKVEYEYTSVEGVLYPKAIYYTGHGGEKGKYSVHFITDADLGENPRADVQVSARLGVKQVYNRLLRKIEVKYDNQMVRSYELVYGKGEYEKTLLKEIRQYDADGQLFYANAMSYYNDVRDENGNHTPFGKLEEWSVPKDNLGNFFEKSGISGRPTLAGSSTSTTKGVNYRVGVGITGNGQFNVSTIGGGGGNSWGNTQSKVMLQDIDGDGLADKVYIDKDDRIHYRKNLSAIGKKEFGQAIRLKGISNIGKTKSYSYNYGVDLQLKQFSVGYNRQISKSTTESYFMDFNGDGLVDFASGGKVYYNRLINDIPHFELSSSGTPSPVMSSGTDILLNGNSEIDKSELENKNPLHDVVRTWKAPHSGQIKISHQFNLIQETDPDTIEEKRNYNNNDGTPRADGVKLYFYHKDNKIWDKDINAEDYTYYTQKDSIHVNKDDILYFRVSSKYDGNYDKTYWFPQIEYKDIDANEKDYNGLNLKNYNPIRDVLFNTSLPFLFSEKTTPNLSGILKKKQTSDIVILKIIKYSLINPTYKQELFTKTFEAEEETDFNLNTISLGIFNESETLSILIESPTEINWQNIQITPSISYIDSEKKNIEQKLGVDFKIFDKIDEHYIPQLVEPKQKGKLRLSLTSLLPNPLENNKINGKITITAKQNRKVVARDYFEIKNNILQAIPHTNNEIFDSITPNDKLFIEINLSNRNLYKVLKDKDFKVHLQIKDSIKIPENAPRYPTEKYKIKTTEQKHDKYAVFVPFEAPNAEDKFGKAFRGWGSFILNGTLALENLYESLLVEKYGGYEDDEDNKPDTDEGSFNPQDPKHEEMEVSKAYFIRTNANPQQQKWIGVEEEISLKDNEFSPSRLGENDLMNYLDNSLPALQGGTSRAIPMISESISNAFSANAASVLGASYSNGNSYVKQTVSDLNGDRFPDFIIGDSAQITNPRGGLSEQFVHNIGDFNHSKTQSFGGSMNGGFGHGEAKSSASLTALKSLASKLNINTKGIKDAEKVKNSVSFGGNFSEGNDHAEHTHTDINGDGLADRITENTIQYNVGYRFLPKDKFNFGKLNSGHSTDESLGGGYSMFGGSFSGGINYTSSTSNMQTQFLDLTGDGLSDRVEYLKNLVMVYQNLGNKLSDTPITFSVEENLGRNKSVSMGGGLTFSLPIPLTFIRLSISAGGSYGTNTNRMEASFMDMDGDGHLDYIISESENHLKVAKNKFGKTNMLKGVTNGAGNSWEIDYEWKAPTYPNPNSAWVLKSVKIFDGHTGDGEDFSISHFEYEKPYYDRRERTFYGYEVVKQEAINPQDNSVLRTSVQEFYNQDYFRKSLLKSAYTLGKNGQKLSESAVKYHIANAKTGQEIQDATLNLPETDATSVFIAPSEEIHREYEDKAQPHTSKPLKTKPIRHTPTPPTKPTNNNKHKDYAITWTEISQNQEPPEGWPRYPTFNEPGDVPGPPVQYGEPVTNANVRAGYGFIPNGKEEQNIYYYHPDHLGSNTIITDKDGNVVQNTQYMPFGETLVDEHAVKPTMPYLFNGKELDRDTGLYYYGARYYDPKTSIFLNVDPLAEKHPDWTPYRYGFNNPIRYIDPTGMLEDDYGLDKKGNISLIRKTNESTDKLIALDEQGAETNSAIEVKKGILNNIKREHNQFSKETHTSIKMKGDDDATAIFEFLSQNSMVEWAQVKYGKNLNYISTSHELNSDSSGVSILYKLSNDNYHLREHTHSHPTSTSGPSGFNTEMVDGDKKFAEWIKQYTPNVKLKVYEVKTNKYIKYNHKGIVK